MPHAGIFSCIQKKSLCHDEAIPSTTYPSIVARAGKGIVNAFGWFVIARVGKMCVLQQNNTCLTRFWFYGQDWKHLFLLHAARAFTPSVSQWIQRAYRANNPEM